MATTAKTMQVAAAPRLDVISWLAKWLPRVCLVGALTYIGVEYRDVIWLVLRFAAEGAS